MARPGVTYLDVSNAAHKLIAAGKRPTIETIRIVLGTGSNSTLGAHLRNWKANQDQTQQVATKENLPEELISLLKGLWERVMQQSDAKIREIENETQQDLAALQHEIKRLQHDNTHLQQQFQQVNYEKDNVVHANSVIEQLFNNTKIEIAAVTEKLSGAETQNQEKQAHIDGLKKQNQQIQDNLEHYRTASLEQRMADQLRYEQQQKQLESTMQQILVWQQKCDQLSFENNTIKSNLDEINLQLNVTSSELTSKTQEQQYLRTEYTALQSKFDVQHVSMLELKTQHAVLLQQLEIVRAELKTIIDQNQILAHDKWVLGQENAQLYGQLKQRSFMAKR